MVLEGNRHWRGTGKGRQNELEQIISSGNQAGPESNSKVITLQKEATGKFFTRNDIENMEQMEL